MQSTLVLMVLGVLLSGWSSGATDMIASSSPAEKYSAMMRDLPRPGIGSRDEIHSNISSRKSSSNLATRINAPDGSSDSTAEISKTEVQVSKSETHSGVIGGNETTQTLPKFLSSDIHSLQTYGKDLQAADNSSTSNLDDIIADRIIAANSVQFLEKNADRLATFEDNNTNESRRDILKIQNDVLARGNETRKKASASAKLRPYGITAEYLMAISLRGDRDQRNLGRGRRFTFPKKTTSGSEVNNSTIRRNDDRIDNENTLEYDLTTDDELKEMKIDVDDKPVPLSKELNSTLKILGENSLEMRQGNRTFIESKTVNGTVTTKSLAHKTDSTKQNQLSQTNFNETTTTEDRSKVTSNVSSVSHLNLDLLEEELAKKRNSQDLLLAISILQHHQVPMDNISDKNISAVDNNQTGNELSSKASLPTENRSTEKIASTIKIEPYFANNVERQFTEELINSDENSADYKEFESSLYPQFNTREKITEGNNNEINLQSFTPGLPNTMFVGGQLAPSSAHIKDIELTKKYPREMLAELPEPLYATSDIGFLPNDIVLSGLMHNQRASSSAEEIGKKPSVLLSHNIPLPGRPQIAHSKVPAEKSTKWLILVMDGDCGIISKRMNTFVKFLKAALASKLETKFDDIVIMSVFCDNTFMVNISLETRLYSKALTQLQALAEANTTLLEISGEIFYLEKVLTQDSKMLLGRLKGSSNGEDMELIVYIAVGCVCAFILLSVFVLTVISICNHDDKELHEVKTDCLDRSEFPIRKPNVIYSHKFTQELNPEKYRLTPFEDSSLGGAAPTDSMSCDAPRFGQHSAERCCDRKVFITPSSSKIQLLEEVQEEDEDEFEDRGVLEGEDDYHEEEEEMDDDEDDEFIIESMTRPLETAQHHQMHHHEQHKRSSVSEVHMHGCCHEMRQDQDEEHFAGNYDNPCYDR
ncbi:uncharacterized protein LOC108677162 [Hyalella azteca]|uniref:Uncharacterized protein LOC108677162 n=1 Tax=Hyalella azteca TaxID=294128 RepID=A0A8B7P3X4_HYAAZ|nr:uncharacterized protein LOC108677162 [Hyalella azteca]